MLAVFAIGFLVWTPEEDLIADVDVFWVWWEGAWFAEFILDGWERHGQGEYAGGVDDVSIYEDTTDLL